MLDTAAIGSVIYIWYEGGELRPSLGAPNAIGRACQAAAVAMT